MGEEYRYTQVGILTILMILLAGVFTAFVFDSGIKSSEGQDATILKVTGFVVGGKSFPIDGIQSIETVKNPWYYLWGIKSIPGDWLYSIAPGGRAIKLVFKDNKMIRLGTNRPEEIQQRLDEALGRSV